jgi:hypothetical protein
VNVPVMSCTQAHSYRTGWSQFCTFKLRRGYSLFAIPFSLLQLLPVGFGYVRGVLLDFQRMNDRIGESSRYQTQIDRDTVPATQNRHHKNIRKQLCGHQ